MKKTLAVAGTVVALVVVPGTASAAEAVTVPASLVVQQSNCATDDDGGAKPVDEDNGEGGEDSGDGQAGGEENGGDQAGGEETEGGGSDTGGGQTGGGDTDGGQTGGGDTGGGQTGGGQTGGGDTGGGQTAEEPVDEFTSGRSSFGLPRQQAADCSEALEPGSNYSDEDGDGEPEVKDQADDDGDGQVDEIDTASQVSVVPDGGAETGDGSTGDVVGMTSAGAAVLALLAGFGLWVRRALARA